MTVLPRFYVSSWVMCCQGFVYLQGWLCYWGLCFIMGDCYQGSVYHHGWLCYQGSVYHHECIIESVCHGWHCVTRYHGWLCYQDYVHHHRWLYPGVLCIIMGLLPKVCISPRVIVLQRVCVSWWATVLLRVCVPSWMMCATLVLCIIMGGCVLPGALYRHGWLLLKVGVGGAVKFLVVGTIGKEEWAPRGQLWMEQYFCVSSWVTVLPRVCVSLWVHVLSVDHHGWMCVTNGLFIMCNRITKHLFIMCDCVTKGLCIMRRDSHWGFVSHHGWLCYQKSLYQYSTYINSTSYFTNEFPS